MKRILLTLGASLALGITGVAGVAPTAATAASSTTPRSHVRHWTITPAAVGPVRLGESLHALKKAGFSFYPCGGQHGHPCYFKGGLAYSTQFDVNSKGKINWIVVSAASTHGYAFATKHGIVARRSTVRQLKRREHVTFIGNYGYGDAYQVHKKRTHKWITFFSEYHSTSKSVVYAIAVSSYPKPPEVKR